MLKVFLFVHMSKIYNYVLMEFEFEDLNTKLVIDFGTLILNQFTDLRKYIYNVRFSRYNLIKYSKSRRPILHNTKNMIF